jgi:hypothetical protein
MPFFAIYLLIWHLVFAFYLLRPSYIMDPHEGELIATVYGMTAVMAVGFVSARWLSNKLSRHVHRPSDQIHALDLSRVRKFQISVMFIVTAIFAAAVALRGAPPGLGSIFSLSSKNYLEYGEGFVGQIQPIVFFLFLTSGTDHRWMLRWGIRFFAIMMFLVLAIRGPMILMFIQYGALVAFRNAKRWRSFGFMWKIVVVLIVIFAVLIEFMDLGSQLRGTVVSGAMRYLRVAQQAKHWPFGFLLFALYLDIPASNFLWMVDQNLGGAAGFWAIGQSIPSLFRSDNPIPDHMISGTVDGASTYLAPMYLGYGWTGLTVEHLLMGAACYAFSRPSVLRDKPLYAAFFACQLALSCFADPFLNIASIVEYLLIFAFYKVCSQTLVRQTRFDIDPVNSAAPVPAE